MNPVVRHLLLTKRQHPIYGVFWNKGASPALTRTDASVGMVANVGVDSTFARNDFDSAEIFREMQPVTDTYGNVFIRIPKFYIKKTDGAGFKTWQVSKTQYPGFYRPWCFWDFTNSRELPYIDIGKYKATQDGSSRLESKPGNPPLVSTNIVNFRTYAQNNNTGGLLGYQQLDIHVYDIIRTLMFVEFATLDIQSIMQGFTTGQYAAAHVDLEGDGSATTTIVVTDAQGALYRVGQPISCGTALGGVQRFYGRSIVSITANVSGSGRTHIVFDGDSVAISAGDVLYNSGWKNGFSSGIAASSGSIGSNADGKYPCMYRGIESPYGDIWQFVDGVNISDLQAWVCRNAEGYASNVFASPYEQLSYVNHNANNYVQATGYDANNPFAEFPTAVSAVGDSGYKDYYYQTNGERIALVGGSWFVGAVAGVSCWTLSFSSADALVRIGGRLVRKCL